MTHCMDCGARKGQPHGSNCATHERDPAITEKEFGEAVEAWIDGEERIDRIAQSDGSGDHYERAACGSDITACLLNLCGQCYSRERCDETGRKDDAEKPRMDLLLADMPHALEAIARVLTHGARKYADGNWMDVLGAERRYLAAAARHELELAKGSHHDDETGEHHLAHAACCVLFRLELALREGGQ